MRRIILIMVLLVIVLTRSQSQDENIHSRYELSGNILYAYSNTQYQQPDPGSIDQHALTLQPSMGYFLTNNIELLVDLRYMFTYMNDPSWPLEEWTHTVGFDVGASYNIIINPFFTAFLGSKIGLSWTRNIYKQNYSDGAGMHYVQYDSGWYDRQLFFPIFSLGGRFAISKESSFLAIMEYSNTNPKNIYQPQIKNIQRISFGFGLSVFL
jgi:hypothetical protein